MARHLPVPACCATLRTLAQANRVIAANQVGLLKALFKQPTGSLLLRHTGIQFAAIHKSLRSDGKLLLRKSDWTIDAEAEFPGSTAFKEFLLPRAELCKVDKNNVPLRQDTHGKRKPSKADCMWDPIRQLSMLPAADIADMDRAILRSLPYPEAVLHIQHLLDKNASPQREPVTVVSPELQASFNHCMATAPEKDCANDDVMVIQA